jgi:hypothetical protein
VKVLRVHPDAGDHAAREEEPHQHVADQLLLVEDAERELAPPAQDALGGGAVERVGRQVLEVEGCQQLGEGVEVLGPEESGAPSCRACNSCSNRAARLVTPRKKSRAQISFHVS